MESFNFKNQFNSIGYSLAKKAKEEVKIIKKNSEAIVQKLNEDFVRDVKRELFDMTNNFLKEYEYRLNTQISNNIKDINQKLLEKKNKLFIDLKQSLFDTISQRIRNNPKKYELFLYRLLNKHINLFDTDIFIRLNEKDQKLFTKLVYEVKNDKILKLESEILDSVGGFILHNADNSILVDETIESSVEKRIVIIKMLYGQIFTDYIDKRKSATEIMREKNTNRFFEIPDELADFIKKEKVLM